MVLGAPPLVLLVRQERAERLEEGLQRRQLEEQRLLEEDSDDVEEELDDGVDQVGSLHVYEKKLRSRDFSAFQPR